MYKGCGYCNCSIKPEHEFCSLRCEIKKNGGNETAYKKEVHRLTMEAIANTELGQMANVISANSLK